MTPSITVVGSGEVSAKPDMAQIQVGVTTESPTAAKALKANNEAMERLLKTLTEKGIADKDMQTSNLSVSPRYENPQPGKRAELVGYEVTNQVLIRVRKLAGLGEILDELVSKGANQVHGISFSVAEQDPLLDQARVKAMQEAQRKATLYAAVAGVKAGRVLRIEEATPHVPTPQFFGVAATRAAAVPIAPGEQQYHASVTVTYALD
jgi:uncharacterized protein YggE